MSVPTLSTRPFAVLLTGAVLALALSACGSDDPAPAAATDGGAQGAPNGSGAAGGAGGGRGGMPGTFGEIAAADGDVLQVQNQMTGQVAVTVTGDTTITTQAAATLADVTTGVCVVVRSADTDGSGSGSGSSSGDAAPSEVTAASVAVSPASDGGCTGRFGGPGGGGERPSGMPTDLPSDFPTERPSGMPSGAPAGRGGFGTVGQVSSVTDGGFVVDGPNGSVTVTVGADTAYSTQVSAKASTLTVGRCVQVQGDADDTGAVTATSVQVSDKVNDQCGL